MSNVDPFASPEANPFAATPPESVGAGDDTRPAAASEPAPATSSSSVRAGQLVTFAYEHPGNGETFTQTGFVVSLVEPVSMTLANGESYDAPQRACVAWITGGISGPIDVDDLAVAG